MVKFLVGLTWLVVIIEFSVSATETHLDESKIIEKMKEDTRESSSTISDAQTPMETLPMADGKFHVYALPVGEGDAHVLQCPNGDIAIVDLGSQESQKKGFWSTKEIQEFLHGHNDRIKNIVITHNDKDHYKFFDQVFPFSSNLTQLINIYISCTSANMTAALQSWISKIGASNKLRLFNGGRTCGSSNRKLCEIITLCPANPEVEFQVLSANAANCSSSNKNIDSIVIGITFKNFTMQMNGDFEDHGSNVNETGPQKQMVDFYGSKMQVTVYKIAHHGADLYANKPVMRDAVKPKAVYVSADPWYSTWGHPKCSITDYFKDNVKSLCKPGESNTANSFFCGPHPMNYLNLTGRLQQEFSCGTASTIRNDTANEFAIYSTTPSANTINLVHLVTNGTAWGFENKVKQRL